MASAGNTSLINNIEDIRKFQDVLVVLVKTEWNEDILNELEKGCTSVLEEYNIRHQTISVPGAVEIPFAIRQHSIHQVPPAAYISLGCVIRGDTPHFEYVCQAVTSGVSQLNLTLDVPVIFGVLTVNTHEQAIERLGGIHGHKGEEAAVTAIRMILLNQSFLSEQKL